jgi:hypothetical protein
MEMGNLIFGNSRGAIHVERGEGKEDELYRLFCVIEGEDTSGYGCEFENETFSLFPYYWGDCTCGHEDKECAWHEENAHAAECFHARLLAFEERTKSSQRFMSPQYIETVRSWAVENGYPDGWNGVSNHCTCTYNADWDAWRQENDHASDCPIVRPNFHFKPDDYRLDWYKYPLRDSYASKDLPLSEFAAMIDKCVASLRNGA